MTEATDKVFDAAEAAHDEFETMMKALDLFFHVAVCENHTPEERGHALAAARAAFMAFSKSEDDDDFGDAPEEDFGGDDLLEPLPPGTRERPMEYRANAPTSRKVH